jgi:hypothetical protein
MEAGKEEQRSVVRFLTAEGVGGGYTFIEIEVMSSVRFLR